VTLPGLGAALTPGQFPTIQSLSASGYFSIVPGNYNGFPRHTFDIAEDINLVRGRNQISFGVEVQRIAATLKTDNQQNATVSFSGSLSGNALADFFLGLPSSVGQSDGIYVAAAGTLPGFYGEDRFRATDRLTLTAGIRWDPYWPFHALGGRIECFRPNEQSTV
jgi:outer membrane receptor protein involved in Fe transport